MTSTTASAAVRLILRPSASRGHADHGWLKSYHSWSFASYFDPGFMSWGPLRVLNEDLVTPGEGFGRHPHREAEIFSYIYEGELEHKDSLGSSETMKRGDIQMTSTGTGISHSEYNRNTEKTARFLQIWATPNQSRLKPDYYHRHFTDEEKLNKLVKVVAPVGSEGVSDKREATGPTPVHADLTAFASILEPSQTLSHPLASNTTKGYLHLIMRKYRGPTEPVPADASQLVIKSGDQQITVQEGDGLFLDRIPRGANVTIESNGANPAEFVFFELSGQ